MASDKREPRKPKTDFVLVRMLRDQSGHSAVNIVQATTFDFTDYRYLRMCPSADQPVEEWVHKSEVKTYKAAAKKATTEDYILLIKKRNTVDKRRCFVYDKRSLHLWRKQWPIGLNLSKQSSLCGQRKKTLTC